MLIGYARVSTKDQDTALQEDALRKAGVERVFIEKASGAKRDRPQLEAALAQLRPGDTFVVWKFDRLARSLSHLLAITEDLKARGVELISITDKIDTTTPMGKAMFAICGTMAELERDLIAERREAGLAKARAKGVKFGRRSVADPKATRKGAPNDRSGQLAKALLAVRGGMSLSAAAKEYRIGKATLHRHLRNGLSEHSNTERVSEQKPGSNGHDLHA